MKKINKFLLPILFLMISQAHLLQAQYCVPVYSSGCSEGDGLTLFWLDNINQTIPCTGYYHDYTALTTNLYTGVSATITVQVGHQNTYIKVYIDYNHNNVFDANELIGQIPGYSTGTNYHLPFTPPADALTGNTRLRALTEYHFYPSGPCTNQSWGNCEDFTVNISIPEPPTVTTGAATLINLTGATLNGTVNANNFSTAVSFEYGVTDSYGSTITATPATVSGSNTESVAANLTGLLPGTTYHFRAKGVSAGGTVTGMDQTFFTACNPAGDAGAISGPVSICANTNYTYTVGVIPNADNYAWTLPDNATIVTGAGTNSVTVVFSNLFNSGILSVNGVGCGGAGAASSLTVNVVPLPVPTITGPDHVCPGMLVMYTTEPGKSGYQWSVSSGGSSSDEFIHVIWSVAGSYSVSVNYKNACGLYAPSPTVLPVTVDPMAAISLTSEPGTANQSLCINNSIANIVYTANSGTSAVSCSGLPAGVSGTFAAGVFTISGTPTVTGTFYYTVFASGYCWSPVPVTATGTITVYPNASLTLTSGAGSDSVFLCQIVTIPEITYLMGGGATDANVTGLPPGVGYIVTSPPFAEIIISGTPNITGIFNFTVTTNGNCPATANGTIIRTDGLYLTSAPGTDNQSICINSAITNITYSNCWTSEEADFYGLPPGVSGSLSGNVYTINGIPSDTGTYNYTVKALLYSNPPSPEFYAYGTITVISDNTMTLTSGAGTDNQITCINTPITNITYSTTGATGATITGLPTGVTGSWEPNTVTITGSPSVSGTFNYTVTLTGGLCNNSSTGTIIVNPLNTITLTSGAGTDSQTLCINTPITNITYSTTGATGATFTSLPPGVSGSWAANTVTISGSPNVIGSFNYTVSLIGPCGNTSATGTITVNQNTITLTSAPGTDNQTLCINTPITTISYSTAGATGVTFTGLPTGVTGSWEANSVTITGSPSASGTYNYTVNLTGGCGNTTANGTITVISDNTMTLTSGAGTDNQTPCINTPITNISYSTAGATGATFTGLPIGVTGSWEANTVTISGSPSVSGTYNYTVALTGGCGNTTVNGTITVDPENSITLTSGVGTNNQTKCVNTPITTIIYSTVGATGATFTDLPPDVSGSWDANTVTISGTPSVAGTYNYTVTLTGGCGNISHSGTITVKSLPIPAIIGSNSVCLNSTGNVYSTQAGMTGYTWSVSSGGTITSGGTSVHSYVTVKWVGSGAQIVAVNYINGNGCTAISPTTYNVAVNPLPSPTLTGPASICQYSPGNVYSTEPGKSNYTWIIPAGATITSGGGITDNTVTLTWTTAGAKIITVNYANEFGCFAPTAKQLTVTVKAAPVPVITGPASIKVNTNGTYSTTPWQTGYTWTISPGGIINSGQGTRAVSVKWTTVGPHWIGLSYTNLSGCTAPTPTIKNVTVTAAKSTIVDAVPVPVVEDPTGVSLEPGSMVLYPNPNDGLFTIDINTFEPRTYDLQVYSSLGAMVYELKGITIEDRYIRKLDLSNLTDGVYNLVLRNKEATLQKRVIIRK